MLTAKKLITMKRKPCKPNTAPLLLCWDIYSEWLNNRLGILPTRFEKLKKHKKL